MTKLSLPPDMYFSAYFRERLARDLRWLLSAAGGRADETDQTGDADDWRVFALAAAVGAATISTLTLSTSSASAAIACSGNVVLDTHI
jgi:hypothetical protein